MKILLTGGGRMGRMVQEEARQKGWEVLAVLDKENAGRLAELQRADLVLDFSHPDMLEPLQAYVRRSPGFYTLEDILFASPKEERTVLG